MSCNIENVKFKCHFRVIEVLVFCLISLGGGVTALIAVFWTKESVNKCMACEYFKPSGICVRETDSKPLYVQLWVLRFLKRHQ